VFLDFIDRLYLPRPQSGGVLNPKGIKIGIVSKNTKKLLDNKFGFGVQDIDKDGVIHALDKPAHNLDPDDLLRMVDIINTSQDITLSPEKHQNNQVLIFKKDVDGELTVLAEFRKKMAIF
jgi:hypothetical protein